LPFRSRSRSRSYDRDRRRSPLPSSSRSRATEKVHVSEADLEGKTPEEVEMMKVRRQMKLRQSFSTVFPSRLWASAASTLPKVKRLMETTKEKYM
jgi:hypothetical protein